MKISVADFMKNHPGFYIGAFFLLKPLPSGNPSFNDIVKAEMGRLCSGPWINQPLKDGGKTLILIAFADKADFDAAKAHFAGRPWTSPYKGTADAFQHTA